jgi:hypothetical protein
MADDEAGLREYLDQILSVLDIQQDLTDDEMAALADAFEQIAERRRAQGEPPPAPGESMWDHIQRLRQARRN